MPGTGALITLSAGVSRGARASVVAAFGCTLGIVPHLVPGGLIFMDDSADGCPFGSGRVAQEFKSNPDCSVVFKTGHYLFRREK